MFFMVKGYHMEFMNHNQNHNNIRVILLSVHLWKMNVLLQVLGDKVHIPVYVTKSSICMEYGIIFGPDSDLLREVSNHAINAIVLPCVHLAVLHTGFSRQFSHHGRWWSDLDFLQFVQYVEICGIYILLWELPQSDVIVILKHNSIRVHLIDLFHNQK